MQNSIAAQKFPYHQSWFHYQSASFKKWTTIYKNCGGEVGIDKKQQYQYNGYSAKERAGIGKYSAEVFLHLLCNLCNMYTLKLTPSCKLIYMRTYVRTDRRTYVRMYVCMYACMYVRMCTHMCVCAHACISMRVRMCICMYYICTYIYLHVHTIS